MYFIDSLNSYTIKHCTSNEIPSHIEKVLSYWIENNADIDEQTKLLTKSIQENLAIQLIDSQEKLKAVIYCIPVNTTKDVMSNLLWFKNKKMLTMLGYYLHHYLSIHCIHFLPHSKTFIPFKFIVEDYSIRYFHSQNTPLVIDFHSTKSQFLYEKYFIKGDIQVIYG